MPHRIAVVGTGYVGLVCGACFARLGHSVVCVDRDAGKIASIEAGEIPIFEPGLEDLVTAERAAGRLTFTTDTAAAVRASEAVFIAVGTPPEPKTGNPDLTAVMAVADAVLDAVDGFTVLVTKSTVPVGTARRLEARILERQGIDVAVTSNPEFLREGNAVHDFLEAERIVVGSRDRRAADLMESLYRPLIDRGSVLMVTTPETSELVKHASNAFLSTKIAFINEMARLCEKVGADVEMVAHGMGLDARIGPRFLKPGPGYGGSCFPKDALALANAARDAGSPLSIVETVLSSNNWHKHAMVTKIADAVGGLDGRRIGVLGIAFKSGTDDVREAPALTIISELVKGGARVTAFDPQAMENARPLLNGIGYAEQAAEVAEGADAVVILTEWPEFRDLDFAAMRARMRRPVLIDLRNLVEPDRAEAAGLALHPLGKAARI
ncbi:UDP-glucose/GDP-mannose dehydrogenase family protein [Microbaculum marinum]|uniref:UDP-glucose 6-dehydrogenase n=1 Tax=Microbaculum marinum TaxID=1764581 RepID=A0AAW9S4I7_9HYPH